MAYYVALPNGNYVEVPDDTPFPAARKRIGELFPEYAQPERGLGSLFMDATKKQFGQMGSAFADVIPGAVAQGIVDYAPESVSNALGAKAYAERQRKEATDTARELEAKYPTQYEDFRSVTGPGSAAGYVAESLPSGIAPLAAMGAGAATGAAIGSIVPGVGTALGATIGGGLALFGQTFSEDYQNLLQKTGQAQLGTAIVSGGINAALERFALGKTISALGGKPLKDAVVGTLMKRLGLGVAEGAAVEGLTEGAQAAVSAAAESFVDENSKLFSSENGIKILDNSIRGAIVGGTFKGAGNVITGSNQPTPAQGPSPDAPLATDILAEGAAEAAAKTPAETPVESPVAPAEAASPFANPADTPEDAKIRIGNAATLQGMGYTEGEIASMPVADISTVIAGGITPSQYTPSVKAPTSPATPAAPATPTFVNPNDTPAQAFGREKYGPDLVTLGYTPAQINSLPYGDFESILKGAVPAPAAQTPAAQVDPAAQTPAAGATPTAPVVPASPAPAGQPPAAPVVPAPQAPAPKVPPPPAAPVNLPPALLKGTLRYGAPNKDNLYLSFANDVDRALFVASKSKPGVNDAQYVNWLKSVGFNDLEIKGWGQELRNYMKTLVADHVQTPGYDKTMPVNWMQRMHPEWYNTILNRTPGAPGSTGAVLPPGSTQTPQKAPKVAPLKKPPAAPNPAGTQFDIDYATQKKLEAKIPGISNVLREIHKRLFPGTTMVVRDKYVDAYTLGQSAFFGKTLYLTSNIDAIVAKMPSNPEAQKQYLLKVLFHEMSHPIQEAYLSKATDAQFKAIYDQYVRMRNPSVAERAALLYGFSRGIKADDPLFLNKFLASEKITRQEFDAYVKDQNKFPTPAVAAANGNLESGYVRSFDEWVAEQGARWMTDSLEGLVPKTAFQKFQKDVLTGLRKAYDAIAGALGIKQTKGAFEKFMDSMYGKNATTTFERLGDVGRTAFNPNANLSQLILFDENYKMDQQQKDAASAPTAEGPTFRESRDDVSRETPEQKAKLDAAKAQVPADAKGWDSYLDIVRGEEPGIKTWFNKAMRNLVGAEPGETLGRALLRNTTLSNEPFLSRADTKNLGKFLESHQNSTGRVMGVVTIGPLGYDPKTKSFFYHDGKGDTSLLKIFEKVGVKNMQQAQIVMLAQRELALRAAKQVDGKSKTGLLYHPVTGKYMTDGELQGIVRSASPEVMQASKEFQKFNDKMVEMAIQTGLIPRSLGEQFKTLMYTPMYRYQDEVLKKDRNITLGGDIYDAIKDPDSISAFNKQLASGGAVAADLYQNLLRNYNAIVSAAIRNVAYQETATTLTKVMANDGDSTIGEILSKPGTDPDTGRATITYRVGGEDRHLLIHDAPMFQAIAALSPQEKNAFVRATSFYTGLLRTGVTSTPGFQLVNLIRGLVELKIKTGMPVLSIVRGTLGAVSDVWNKKGAYSDIVGLTGFGGFGFGSGYKNQADYMKREYLSKEKPLNAWNGFLRAFDKLEHIGEVTEMAPRIAYYNYLLSLKDKSGGKMSKADAAWEAVNLVNYHRHGAGNGILGNAISNLIPLTPFLTARIQGLYRLVETGTAGAPKSLVGKGVIGIPAAIVTRGLMVAFINAGVNAMYGDDDWYKKLSVKDRLSNMYVKVGDTVLALPRAYEIGELFGALPTLMLDSIRKKDGNDIAVGVAEFAKKTFLFEPIPQFAKPIAEIVANKNFFTGQPIENLTDRQRKLVEERYDEYTSSVAKYAGAVTKEVGLSPKQVDTLIRGYLGSMATLFLGTVDGAFSAGGTKPAGVFGDPSSVPGLLANATGASRILKTEGQLNNKFIGDFYEVKQKVTEITNSMTEAARIGDAETIKKRIEQMPAAKGLFTAFNAANENLSKMNAQMDVIRKIPNLTPEQKTEYLEKLRKAKGLLAEQMVAAAARVGVTP